LLRAQRISYDQTSGQKSLALCIAVLLGGGGG
jgi:hypothetical protein